METAFFNRIAKNPTVAGALSNFVIMNLSQRRSIPACFCLVMDKKLSYDIISVHVAQGVLYRMFALSLDTPVILKMDSCIEQR